MASTKNMNSNCHSLGTKLKQGESDKQLTSLGNALINGTTTLQSLHRLAESAGLRIEITVEPVG